MTYQIIVAPRVSRQLSEHLPHAVAAALIEFIFGPLAENPHRVGGPLDEPFAGQRRARRGEYRVRYRIDERAMAVRVLHVSHRRDAYRPH